MFTLRISTNGQPDIVISNGALETIDGHLHYRNDGFNISPKCYTGATVDSVAADLRAVAGAAKVRKCKRTVSVRHPAAMVAAVDAIDADWQKWAAAGLSHMEMRNRAINHPAYLAA